MNKFPQHAELVIIGGGIVGTSAAWFLSQLGWTGVVVVEQGSFPQPGGSSSHAPGGMFQTNPSKMMCEIARFGTHFYAGLEHRGAKGAVLCGGIELAETDARLRELHRRCGLGRSWGLEGEVISPQECGNLLPHLDIRKVKGGYYVADDGVGRAVVCTQALIAKAQAAGVQFFDDTQVLDIATSFDRLGRGQIQEVQTSRGPIKTGKILCCAGFWGPKIGAMVGQPIPLKPMGHFYAISQPIPELQAYPEGIEANELVLPLVRSQDHDLYFRQHYDKWSVGYYGHAPIPKQVGDILSPQEAPIMPSLIDWDADAYRPGWQAGANLFPSIGAKMDFSYNINGIFSFTPDGHSFLGESAAVKGFWVAEAVWYTHAAGMAKAVSEWMDSGEPQMDLHEADVNRFYPHFGAAHYTLERSKRTYIEVYDILHPKVPSGVCRNLRQSPMHHRHVERGAYLLEAAGYERPQWYEANRPLLEKLPHKVAARDSWSAQHYSPIEAAEAWQTRHAVALYDMSAFAVFELQGDGSFAALQRLCTNKLDVDSGRMVYTNLLDDRGGIVCDLTVMRMAEERFLIPTGGASGPHDFQWLRNNLDDDPAIHLSDVSNQYITLGLWGPQAQVIASSLAADDLSQLRFFRFKRTFLRDIPVIVARLSYVGESGFEVYTSPDYGLALWDLLVEAGAVPCGFGAFDSLRIEKGMKGWGADLDPDHTPLQAGLDFIVRFDHAFKGKHALQKQQREGVPSRMRTLEILDGQVVMGKEPLYAAADGWDCVGYVTSANYGHTVRKSLALGYVTSSHAGQRLWVDYFGQRHEARIIASVPFDARGERMRS